MIASILFLVFASISVVARPAGDRVTSLPGAIEAIAGEMFAGYVNVSETRNMFYWTNFEPNTMKHDTLLVWFAGGPGKTAFLRMMQLTPAERRVLGHSRLYEQEWPAACE